MGGQVYKNKNTQLSNDTKQMRLNYFKTFFGVQPQGYHKDLSFINSKSLIIVDE